MRYACNPRVHLDVQHPFKAGDLVRSARIRAQGVVEEIDPDGTVWVLWEIRPGEVSRNASPKEADLNDITLVEAQGGHRLRGYEDNPREHQLEMRGRDVFEDGRMIARIEGEGRAYWEGVYTHTDWRIHGVDSRGNARGPGVDTGAEYFKDIRRNLPAVVAKLRGRRRDNPVHEDDPELLVGGRRHIHRKYRVAIPGSGHVAGSFPTESEARRYLQRMQRSRPGSSQHYVVQHYSDGQWFWHGDQERRGYDFNPVPIEEREIRVGDGVQTNGLTGDVVKVARVNVTVHVRFRASPTGPWYEGTHIVPKGRIFRLVRDGEMYERAYDDNGFLVGAFYPTTA